MYVLVTCKNKEDQMINIRTRTAKTFNHYDSVGIFQTLKDNYLRCLWSIWPNYELVREFIVNCKTVKYPIIMKALECSQQYRMIFQTLKGSYSIVSGGIWPKFKPIQAFEHVPVTCKNKEDVIKNEGARVFTKVLPI